MGTVVKSNSGSKKMLLLRVPKEYPKKIPHKTIIQKEINFNNTEPTEIHALKALKEIGLSPGKLVKRDDQWVCPFEPCGVLSTTLDYLKTHFFTVHNTRPYACDIDSCVWTFPTKSKLERHKRAHVLEKGFLCNFEGCGKTFKTSSNLRHHKKLVHESAAKFHCTIGNCQAAFHNQKKLDFHRSEHDGATPGYKCDVPNCGKSFFTRNALCSHMRRHEYKDGDLRCKLCGKEFEVPCRLRSHMQGHENERPYPCTDPGCQWSFPSQSKLARHMDKHLQNRRFVCSFSGCSKAFLRQQHLTDHIKTHLKVKVYRCPIEMCEAVFKVRKLVQPHVAQVHRICNKSPSQLAPKQHSMSLLSPAKSVSSPDDVSASDPGSSPSNIGSMSKSSYFGSARTSLTYGDVVQGKQKLGEGSSKNDMDRFVMNPEVRHDLSDIVDSGHRSDLGDFPVSTALDVSLGASVLETRDILQADNPAAVQQDIMLSGVNLGDSSNLIMQDELLTQEYFLLLESTNRLADFEPSTINLRDLE